MSNILKTPKLNLVKGDFMEMSKTNNFGVIAQVRDCFCDPREGRLSRRMNAAFNTSDMTLENYNQNGVYNKLGQIEWKTVKEYGDIFWLVNMYAIHNPKNAGPYGIPLDYDALRLCLRKLNAQFEGGEIGLPKIGTGKGSKGDWTIVSRMIAEELTDVKLVTIVTEAEDDESLHAT